MREIHEDGRGRPQFSNIFYLFFFLLFLSSFSFFFFFFLLLSSFFLLLFLFIDASLNLSKLQIASILSVSFMCMWDHPNYRYFNKRNFSYVLSLLSLSLLPFIFISFYFPIPLLFIYLNYLVTCTWDSESHGKQ